MKLNATKAFTIYVEGKLMPLFIPTIGWQFVQLLSIHFFLNHKGQPLDGEDDGENSGITKAAPIHPQGNLNFVEINFVGFDCLTREVKTLIYWCPKLEDPRNL